MTCPVAQAPTLKKISDYRRGSLGRKRALLDQSGSINAEYPRAGAFELTQRPAVIDNGGETEAGAARFRRVFDGFVDYGTVAMTSIVAPYAIGDR